MGDACAYRGLTALRRVEEAQASVKFGWVASMGGTNLCGGLGAHMGFKQLQVITPLKHDQSPATATPRCARAADAQAEQARRPCGVGAHMGGLGFVRS